MAKAKNHSTHHKNRKDHRNGIKKPKIFPERKWRGIYPRIKTDHKRVHKATTKRQVVVNQKRFLKYRRDTGITGKIDTTLHRIFFLQKIKAQSQRLAKTYKKRAALRSKHVEFVAKQKVLKREKREKEGKKTHKAIVEEKKAKLAALTPEQLAKRKEDRKKQRAEKKAKRALPKVSKTQLKKKQKQEERKKKASQKVKKPAAPAGADAAKKPAAPKVKKEGAAKKPAAPKPKKDAAAKKPAAPKPKKDAAAKKPAAAAKKVAQAKKPAAAKAKKEASAPTK